MDKLIVSFLEECIDDLTWSAKHRYESYEYNRWDKYRRSALINTLKERSKYKRSLKAYKKLFTSK